MSEIVTPDKFVIPSTPNFRRHAEWTRVRYLIIPALALVALLVFYGAPWLLWAYNLEQAGRSIDSGLAWPKQRLVDSLPESRNSLALDNALSHLATAIRWRPGQEYPYRLLGQVYAARHDWPKAAQALEHARALAPQNRLSTWESALIYEQMWRDVQTAPKETLMPDLVSAPIEAPGVPIRTIFCHNNVPQTCYVGPDKWTQPYAAFPDAPPVAADVLFMHPPSSVKLTHSIYADHPVMHFLVGLDPGMHGSATDGATFQVWVDPAGGASRLVYERTVDGLTAKRGWVPGSADLSPWAGRTVTLVLRTTGSPANASAGDWYGWGNVTLTTREAAQYAVLAPDSRMRQAWQDDGLDAAKLLALGKQARYRGQYDQALAWFERAVAVEPDWGEPWYRMGEAYKTQQKLDKAQQSWDKALKVLQQAAGRSPDNRDTWYVLGQVYAERKELDAALQAFQRGIGASPRKVGLSNLYLSIGNIRQFALSPPDLDGAWAAYQQALAIDNYSDELGMSMKALTHHSIGLILASRERWNEARREFQQAVSLAQYDTWFHVSLARSLWKLGQREPAKEQARRALDIYRENVDAYRLLGDISRAEGNVVEARAMYTKVLELAPQDDAARKAIEKLGR